MHTIPSVINPSVMNGNNNTTTQEKKVHNKNSKVTLDKNGKPKRKKASRGEFPIGLKGLLTNGFCVACQSCQKAHLTCDDGMS